MVDRTCLVVGVGDGTGAAVARRFASDGYRVAMIARNAERLGKLENELEGSRSYSCDISDLEKFQAALALVRKDMGAPEVVVHNAIATTYNTFLDGNPTDLERNFRVNTTTLLYLARDVAPAMIDMGGGAILVTGGFLSFRRDPNTALFAPTKAAQRILAESLARDLWPKGIHVAYINIDALIDTPRTRLSLGADRPDEAFSMPAPIAEEIFHLANQDRSTWTFDLTIRPFGEQWNGPKVGNREP